MTEAGPDVAKNPLMIDPDHTRASVIRLERGSRSLIITWGDGSQSLFHHLWLRDNDSATRDRDSGQRRVHPEKIPPETIPWDIQPATAMINDERQRLVIVWEHDDHESHFDLDWLHAHRYSHREHRQEISRIYWDAACDLSLQAFAYPDAFSDKETLFRLLVAYRAHGFVTVHDVPRQPRIVEDIGRALSYVWNGGRDDFFEIAAQDEAAPCPGHTGHSLPPHTDHPYHDPVPPVELLHCLENQTTGGDVTLVDGFHLARTLRRSEPRSFDLLTTCPVPFRRQADGRDLRCQAPIIELDWLDQPRQIRFCNRSMQPLQLPEAIMETYYAAYRRFSELAVRDDLVVRLRLQPGDLLMFDNHRVLHGRSALPAAGERLLQGCFIARDGLFSTLEITRQELDERRRARARLARK